MTFDARTEANIATLTPATQDKARAFLEAIIATQNPAALPPNWTVKIISGTRTYAQQDALYAQGRNGNPGRIVTKATGGHSNHNFGIAFDLGIYTDTCQYIDDLPDQGVPHWSEGLVSSFYRNLQPIGTRLGLEWGGDWKSMEDDPHWELNLWPDLNEDQKLAKLRAMHANGEEIG